MVSKKDENIVKTIIAPEYTDDEINRYLESKIKMAGRLNKKTIEFLDKVLILHRPFRRIKMKLHEGLSSSLIDEEFAGTITDSDHRFLLWRPRLAGHIEDNIREDEKIDPYPDNEESVRVVLDELLQLRWTGQEKDEELRSELRTLQADPLSSLAFIVPRSPGGLRRENKLLEGRKASHAYVLASSLVSNCSPKDIILSVEIGDRVFIETIVAEYRNIEDDAIRLLFLETSGTSSLQAAQKAGFAVTRICQLYKDCHDQMLERLTE